MSGIKRRIRSLVQSLGLVQPRPVRCVALILVRNEVVHLRRLLPALIDQGIDVVVIDNDSSDGAHELYETYQGRGLLWHERLPFEGVFDLKAALLLKRDIAARLEHDWIISIDADEWMHSPRPGESLTEGLARAQASGANVVNFEEFVFLPLEGDFSERTDYPQHLRHYYFFCPEPHRLMRAWRRDCHFSNAENAGHRIAHPRARVFEENFVLRHYITLSQAHIVEKYVGREFPEEALARGWHFNRVGLTEEMLAFPPDSSLKQLPRWDARPLETDEPKKKHYWQW
ncbi:MAG: glycosyltransferase family 2 protein [Pseudomonadota bacterium]